MLSINNSYFDPILCTDGHYIITGRTNDQFCLDTLELTDILPALHAYLRYEQGFDAVFFFDSYNMLYCMDRASYAILTGRAPAAAPAPAPHGGAISAGGPLGRRRRRPAPAPAPAPGPDPDPQQGNTGPLNLGRMSMGSAWQQVSSIMQRSDQRCALVIANANLMQGGEMLMTELNTFRSARHSVVISIFRETTIQNVSQWDSFARSVLEPRMNTNDPERNRVISLPSPNCREIRNLLNHFRIEPSPRLRVEPGDIPVLGQRLAESCARNNWGLTDLITRLTSYATRQGETLSLRNWRAFIGEENRRPALERLAALVGQDTIKNQIQEWRDDQQRHAAGRAEPVSSSRFAPLPVFNGRRGFRLNVRLKGSPGTGKSTIADLLGEIYYDLGLLPQAHVVTASAATLVSPNIGETARLVHQRVEEAMGGVLLIDEAYALYENAHGYEAITSLVNDISAYEGQFAVIVAGYSRQIDTLMRTNPGLASRIPTEYILEDYAPAQMQQIFLHMVEQADPPIRIDSALRERLDDFFESWVGSRGENWANARECVNLLEEMRKRCGAREAAAQIQSPEYTLTIADVPDALSDYLRPRSRGPAEALQRIDAMIGLDNVKSFLRTLVQRIQLGEKIASPGNFLFLGPPGTGKTTVARRMGELLHLLGVLGRDHVTECRAADLLNGSVHLNEMVEHARRGVFFLDEAHQLAASEEGRAIIRALVPLIEDPEIHADTCFICAGYADKMQSFLDADAGLNRRFPQPNRIRFYDYTADELTDILREMAQQSGQIPSDEYLQRSLAALDAYLPTRPADFGNGGFIRETYLPGSIQARATRLAKELTGAEDGIPTEEQLASVTDAERRTLTAADLPPRFARLAGPVGRVRPERRTALQRVEGLIGKDKIIEFAHARIQGEEEGEGFLDEQAPASLQYAIVGPSGSGRHTAVHALAALWRESGLLERDDVTPAGFGDLVGEYVGSTPRKTREVIERARGGTLLVEFPSSLLPKNSMDNSFGPEALGEISGAMTAFAEDTSFVLIDTPEGIEALFKAQPGMRSRLSRVFTLEDLLPAQMEEIFRRKTADSFEFAPDVEDMMHDFFLNWVSNRGGLGDASRSWGNGMEIDKLIEDLKIRWKNSQGETHMEKREENGKEYTLQRRYIQQDHFPPEQRKYLRRTSAVSDSALQGLEELPGLTGVKASIKNIRRRIRRLKGGQKKPGCYLYLGNPGVGKTSVARLMGGVLKATGVLSQGHVIERTARQLMSQPEEFDSTLKLARGGILFIDEAPQLGEDLRGREVIKRLLTVLEDDDVTDTTSIILAGYPGPMMDLLRQDEGLESRFGSEDSRIFFEDYNESELVEIMEYMADRADSNSAIGAVRPLQLDEDFIRASRQVFRAVLARHDQNFGNARFVRTYLHDALNAQLERLDREYGEAGEPPEEAADRLTGADIPARYRGLAERRRIWAQPDPARMDLEHRTEVTDVRYNDVCETLSASVVLLQVWKDGRPRGSATGTIVTSDGLVLTCAHVVSECDRIRARIHCPGAPGGDTHWLETELLEPVCESCDMAMLRILGSNFTPAPMRRPDAAKPRPGERTLLLGYPLGGMLSGNNIEQTRISNFAGGVASIQLVGATERCYIDSTGLHGNSGSPVFSREDGRMIGVFSGSVRRDNDSLDELNYFYPIHYFWERFALSQQPAEEEESENGDET